MEQEPNNRPESIKVLTDRELMEAVYRGIYGEEPIHPGLAKRVTRLERVVLLILLILVGAGLVEVVPNVAQALS